MSFFNMSVVKNGFVVEKNDENDQVAVLVADTLPKAITLFTDWLEQPNVKQETNPRKKPGPKPLIQEPTLDDIRELMKKEKKPVPEPEDDDFS